MATPEKIEEFDKINTRIADAGAAWYQKLASELEKKYAAGTFVAINIATGEYVIGTSDVEVMQKTERDFPAESEFYIRRIVGPHPFVSFAGCES